MVSVERDLLIAIPSQEGKVQRDHHQEFLSIKTTNWCIFCDIFLNTIDYYTLRRLFHYNQKALGHLGTIYAHCIWNSIDEMEK